MEGVCPDVTDPAPLHMSSQIIYAMYSCFQRFSTLLDSFLPSLWRHEAPVELASLKILHIWSQHLVKRLNWRKSLTTVGVSSFVGLKKSLSGRLVSSYLVIAGTDMVNVCESKSNTLVTRLASLAISEDEVLNRSESGLCEVLFHVIWLRWSSAGIKLLHKSSECGERASSSRLKLLHGSWFRKVEILVIE